MNTSPSQRMSSSTPRYDPESIRPMREDLVRVGFEELLSARDVEEAFDSSPGTLLLMINSVCGCSAGAARPGTMLALQHSVIPDRLVTVFAGQDIEATEAARRFIGEHAPSSPCLVLFKEGRPVFLLQRRDIERTDARSIAAALVNAFQEFCTAPGPSISREEFEKIIPYVACGSSVSGKTC